MLGYHLEGPFLSPSKPGCHPPDNVRAAEKGWKSFLEVYGKEALRPEAEVRARDRVVKVITLAPEVQGTLAGIEGLKKAGFVVSVGHS